MDHPIRVILADNHPLIRTGIRSILNETSQISIVGEAEDGNMAQCLSRQLQPNVLLLDLRMPGPSAIEIVANIHTQCPTTKVLVLTAYDDTTYVQSLITAGVAGYILKDEAPEILAQAIFTVVRGRKWFSQTIVEKLALWQTNTVIQNGTALLTEREQQIMGLIAQGWSNASIAAKLHLAEQTIRNHASRIYAKLGVRSRVEAIVWFQSHGIMVCHFNCNG